MTPRQLANIPTFTQNTFATLFIVIMYKDIFQSSSKSKSVTSERDERKKEENDDNQKSNKEKSKVTTNRAVHRRGPRVLLPDATTTTNENETQQDDDDDQFVYPGVQYINGDGTENEGFVNQNGRSNVDFSLSSSSRNNDSNAASSYFVDEETGGSEDVFIHAELAPDADAIRRQAEEEAQRRLEEERETIERRAKEEIYRNAPQAEVISSGAGNDAHNNENDNNFDNNNWSNNHNNNNNNNNIYGNKDYGNGGDGHIFSQLKKRKVLLIGVGFLVLVVVVGLVVGIALMGSKSNNSSPIDDMKNSENNKPTPSPSEYFDGGGVFGSFCNVDSSGNGDGGGDNNNDDDCQEGLFCNGYVNMCDRRMPGSILALCFTNDHCLDESFNTCARGVCVRVAGESCPGEEFGYYCESSVCGTDFQCTSVPPSDDNNNVNDDDPDAAPTDAASTGGPFGAPCTTGTNEMECQEGLVCNQYVQKCDNRTPGGGLALCYTDEHCLDESFDTCARGVCVRVAGEFCPGMDFGYYCESGTCDSSTNRCADVVVVGQTAAPTPDPGGAVGESCIGDDDCQDNLQCNQYVQRCDHRTPGGILALCFTDEDCFDESFDTCTGGRCKRVSGEYCPGIEFGYYCESGVCDASINRCV